MRSALSVLLLFAGLLTAEDLRRAEGFFQNGLQTFDEALAWRREHPTEREQAAARFRKAAEFFLHAAALVPSSEVFTNLANSYYFAGEIGEAVLFWRRALSVDPGNDRARRALEAVRKTLPFQKERSSVADFASVLFLREDPWSLLWRFRLFVLLFPAAWLLFAVEAARRRWPAVRVLLVPIFPLAALGAALGYLFRLRRPYAIVGAFCLVPAVLLLWSLLWEGASSARSQEAVILVEALGRRGDGPAYSPSHSGPFPPGTEVHVLEERRRAEGAWALVRLPDGSTSWVPQSALERVLAPIGSET